jgi:hypothetical protein
MSLHSDFSPTSISFTHTVQQTVWGYQVHVYVQSVRYIHSSNDWDWSTDCWFDSLTHSSTQPHPSKLTTNKRADQRRQQNTNQMAQPIYSYISHPHSLIPNKLQNSLTLLLVHTSERTKSMNSTNPYPWLLLPNDVPFNRIISLHHSILHPLALAFISSFNL